MGSGAGPVPRASDKANRVAMLFSRGFFPDARGHKEAKDLAQAGYEVTILAWDRERRLARCRYVVKPQPEHGAVSR